LLLANPILRNTFIADHNTVKDNNFNAHLHPNRETSTSQSIQIPQWFFDTTIGGMDEMLCGAGDLIAEPG
jgi:hypothetical protein